jgi:enoyl-CoA hydratase
VTEETDQAVLFEVTGHIATITINRPQARNAVNQAVAEGMEDALDRLESDSEIWVGVLTAALPVFCAGADLKEINAGRRDLLRTERGGFAGIVARQRSTPLVAAVEGPALGGGAEICLACDLVVASTCAVFGIPEVKRSLIAAGGGLFRLPRRLPLNLAMELALTGEPIDATRAHAHGLVNVLTKPGDALEAALSLAARIEANAPVAVRASRRVMLESAVGDESRGWELSSEAMAEAMASNDLKEGLEAFMQKRPPRWWGT